MSGEDRVIIIGGGPAGSTMGCYLSKAGVPNTIIESAVHPRPHVGESLVTSTTRMFDEIGFLPTMESEGFVKKFGAAWHPPQKTGTFGMEFREFPQPGVHQDHSYHVDRAKFDMLLLKHAEKLGSTVIQGTPVNEVRFDGDRAVGVAATVAGQKVNIPARAVIDASGRKTLLGRHLDLKEKDPVFDQFAVHAWFENVDKGEAADEDYIHIYFLPTKRGWAWQIPITETVTSIGVVAERSVFKEMGGSVEAWFESHLESAPDFARAMKNARRVNDFKREADYSYAMTRFVGNGWMLVGDAARFVDPIFSSGVSVAMSSAKFASQTLVEGLARGDISEAALTPYETKLRGGVNVWYEFISLYYRLLPLFTVFINSKKHRQGVLELLQGEVFDREDVPVLDAMRKYIETVEKSDSHVFKAYLDDVAA
ncbi:MAG: NAD(P)/FAD-dependent oxidoreductase [Myxococcota bacterium]